MHALAQTRAHALRTNGRADARALARNTRAHTSAWHKSRVAHNAQLRHATSVLRSIGASHGLITHRSENEVTNITSVFEFYFSGAKRIHEHRGFVALYNLSRLLERGRCENYWLLPSKPTGK